MVRLLLAFLLASWAAGGAAAADQPLSHGAWTESQIAKLHDELRLTPKQEARWKAVARVMRENAKKMDVLLQQRADKADTATALDDLAAYEAFAQAHVAGLKKLTPVFAQLYKAMPESQKKRADEVFRSHEWEKPDQKADQKAP